MWRNLISCALFVCTKVENPTSISPSWAPADIWNVAVKFYFILYHIGNVCRHIKICSFNWIKPKISHSLIPLLLLCVYLQHSKPLAWVNISSMYPLFVPYRNELEIMPTCTMPCVFWSTFSCWIIRKLQSSNFWLLINKISLLCRNVYKSKQTKTNVSAWLHKSGDRLVLSWFYVSRPFKELSYLSSDRQVLNGDTSKDGYFQRANHLLFVMPDRCDTVLIIQYRSDTI